MSNTMNDKNRISLARALAGGVGMLLLVGALLLSACGGGGGGGGTATPAPPAITSQPVNQAVVAGAAATFSVAATGTSLAYQWQSSPDGTTWADVSGATGTTLTQGAAAIADNGRRFRVVVSNSVGSATSGVAALIVTAASSAFSTLTPTLKTGRVKHAATLLASGQVLITGGFSTAVFPSPALTTAELYDPTTNAFTALAGTMRSGRTNHTATRLPDGRVLLAGGQDNNDGDGRNSAELYDPATQTFTAVAAAMTTPRGGHGAALLPNGRVLLAGGFNNSSVALNSAELFDPATQAFTALASTMASRRSDFVAISLQDGKVLLTGGDSSRIVFNSAELYDPTTQTFTAIFATMDSPREVHAMSLLPNGMVLITGGGTLGSAFPATSVLLDTAELYDPGTQTFTAVAARMTSPRGGHTQTLLASGAILLTGGVKVTSSSSFVVLSSAEVYGP